MTSLDRIKTIIDRANSDLPPDLYSEIDASLVFEEDWIHLGEDYFYNRIQRQVAGPNAGGTRVVFTLISSMEVPVTRDISHEWERQAGSEPIIIPEESRDIDKETPFAHTRPAGGKCACDS